MGRQRASNDPSVRTELTERQREVLQLIVRGRTNGQIAEELGLSLDVVKWHVREILTRLGVDSREEAAEWWRRNRGMGDRLPAWFGWPLAAGFGGATAAVVAVVFAVGFVIGTAGSDGPEVAHQPDDGDFLLQPELTLAAEGGGWRVYVDEQGGVPHAGDAVLAVETSHQTHDRVFVIDAATGRIGMLVETLPQPIALLRVSANELVVSDALQLYANDEGEPTHRVLVFDLDNPGAPLREGFLSGRFNYRFVSDGDFFAALSSDEQFLYWRQYGAVPQRSTISAVALDSMSDTAAFDNPGCASPETIRPAAGSALLVLCHGRVLLWDAALGADAQVEEVEHVTRALNWRDIQPSLTGDLVVRRIPAGDWDDMRVALLDPSSGAVVADHRFQSGEFFDLTVVSEREAIVLGTDGSLLSLDLFTGERQLLPYRLDLPSGLSIALTR